MRITEEKKTVIFCYEKKTTQLNKCIGFCHGKIRSNLKRKIKYPNSINSRTAKLNYACETKPKHVEMNKNRKIDNRYVNIHNN